MPWVRLDDHFDENPKVLSVGPLGLALCSALCEQLWGQAAAEREGWRP